MEEWFLFTHPVSGRHYRLNRKAYELIARLDGQQTLDALWNGLQHKWGDEAPTQDEVIILLTQLTDAGFLLFDTPPDWPALQEADNNRRRQELSAALNPFAFKVRLFDPANLLNRLQPLRAVLFQPFVGLLWLVLVGWALARAAMEWDSIRAYAAIHMLTPRYLLLVWCLYPVIKALHELGHAFAVRHWGGEVKESGVAFFLLMPAPYVDASSATVFPEKWQRIAVSSAGIIVELAIAAAALFVWGAVESGLVRDIAFVAMAVGGLSTVIFNANPLMRFDGYYIMCDLLELPNLASRSQRLWSGFSHRYILGISGIDSPSERGTERLWLFLYAPASWIYRLFISVVIVQWVAAKSALLALVTIIWMTTTLIARPIWKGLRVVTSPVRPGQRRWQPMFRAVGVLAILIAAFIWLPIPSSTVASGLVWTPEQAQIRSKSAGQIIQILARDGQQVSKGDALIVMDEPSLLAERQRLRAKIAGQETEQISNLLIESARSRNAAHQLDRLRSDLAQLDEQMDELTLRAETDGVFVLPHRDDEIGRHVQKGTLLAYVISNDVTTVRAVVTQDDEGRIKAGVKTVSVRLSEAQGERFDGRLVREVPAATKQLPSAALGDRAGGEFVTDPADREGLSTLDPVFLVDVQLPKRDVQRLGGRAHIRFEHDAKPLMETVVWHIRQIFLKLLRREGY